MQIKAGKYYRTRGGQVFAPITRGQAAAILAICGAVQRPVLPLFRSSFLCPLSICRPAGVAHSIMRPLAVKCYLTRKAFSRPGAGGVGC